MKRFIHIQKLPAMLALLFLLSWQSIEAQTTMQTDTIKDPMESVKISLLTCQPRQEVWALYGHTAIRIQDERTGNDLAVNYGIFSFGKSWFVLRFMFGLTDYEMTIDDYQRFAWHYASVGSGILQQTLNLTSDEKRAILHALEVNNLPENRVYRYNYYYDNCTTRARDIIARHLNGKVDYHAEAKTLTYRQLIHAYNADHPWARLGNDLLLGVGSDRVTTTAEQQFLPQNLMTDFGCATLTDADGKERPLVSETSWAVEPRAQIAEKEFPLSPTQCAWLCFAILLGTTAYEWRRKTLLWAIDLVALTAAGLCGLILLAMVFSQHPTVKLNYQILVLNPLLLVFLLPIIKSLRQQKISWHLFAYMACIILATVLGMWQRYAEGFSILASSLLLRYGITLFRFELKRR